MEKTAGSLLKQGYQARREHRYGDAKSLYAEAAELCRNSNDCALLAKSLTGLGQIERDLHELAKSLAHYEEAAAILRNLDDPQSLAHTIRHVGDIQREMNQLAPAAASYAEALTIYRSHPATETLDLANTLRGYALLKAAIGEREAAKCLWQEAGTLYAQVDVQAGVAESARQVALLAAN